MLTQEDDVDIHALRRRGWSISAIARHVGRDRKTVRAYLEGKRQVGQRAPAGEDAFARFVDCAAARLAEDPHLWATALHDEVVKLGYDRSYPSFTRALRSRGLRPACEPCHPTKGRPAAVIEHPPGVRRDPAQIVDLAQRADPRVEQLNGGRPTLTTIWAAA